MLGMSRACRTVSNDALQVLMDKPPIDLVAAERSLFYWARREETRSVIGITNSGGWNRQVRDELRRVKHAKLLKWQARWSGSENGRVTFEYIPEVSG